MNMRIRKQLLAILAAASLALSPAGAQVTGGSGPSGGSVSVTSACPSIVVNPSPGTGTFTIGATAILNAQTGTTYTVLSSDACKIVSFNNAASVAVTLPQATGSFTTGFDFVVQNKGAGTVTITPTTSTVNGAATLTVAQNRGCEITSDGTNWQVSACNALVSGGGTPCTSVANSLQYNNSGAFGCVTGATWDGTNLVVPNLTSSTFVNFSTDIDLRANGSTKISTSGGSIFFSSFSAWGSNGAGLGSATPTATSPSVDVNWAGGSDGLGQGATHSVDIIANATDVVRVLSTGMAMQAGVFTLKGFTVSTLPASPATGSEAYVTDANAACTYMGTPTGGGSTFCKVVYTGAAWKEG